MGLYPYMIESIARLREHLPQPFNVLSLGHPDVLGTPKELEPIVGGLLTTEFNEGFRPFSRNKKGEELVLSAKVLFEALGASLNVVDVRYLRGVDIIADLNSPVDLGSYDLVVDPGTTEHCFNVAQALQNVAQAVKVGGFVWHVVPLADWNQGFWNFSPTAFAHFYARENGFMIWELFASERQNHHIPVSANGKFRISNSGRKLYLHCIAKRLDRVPISYPMQAKYEDSPSRE